MVESWLCDSCGRKIESVEDGWIEWLKDRSTEKLYGLRIVHHQNDCMYDDRWQFDNNNALEKNMDLEHFLNQDGFMTLLSFISENEFKDNNEVLEVIKHLFIPDYEAARHHFGGAIQEEYFEPNTLKGFYRQSDIERTMDYMRDNGLL
ncbi:hypothetical protein [Falseniella ignava]|uniref:Uncharacterized protein n=1 Tax=Falseniella ignava CCUG 37419 TaxID=883112 RepID=K1LZU6_9LACT|nr:hypothetical protein [Falseniella ignava]EKB55618.1 hypothetical protein HMPREF9707_01106 [Falseniella ignava CCUG 37419]